MFVFCRIKNVKTWFKVASFPRDKKQRRRKWKNVCATQHRRPRARCGNTLITKLIRTAYMDTNSHWCLVCSVAQSVVGQSPEIRNAPPELISVCFCRVSHEPHGKRGQIKTTAMPFHIGVCSVPLQRRFKSRIAAQGTYVVWSAKIDLFSAHAEFLLRWKWFPFVFVACRTNHMERGRGGGGESTTVWLPQIARRRLDRYAAHPNYFGEQHGNKAFHYPDTEQVAECSGKNICQGPVLKRWKWVRVDAVFPHIFSSFWPKWWCSNNQKRFTRGRESEKPTQSADAA